MREYKSLPQFIKQIDGRTVTGIFAVHGNVDSGLDRSHPGSFAKTFAEQRSRAKFLWNHDFFAPPIATIKALREVGREELPAEVLALAPEATGGAEVTREYLDTPRGNEVLEGIKSGAITEMSYGYDPVKMDFTVEGEGEQQLRIRELREQRLYDVSDVLWGMNPATVGSKAGLPLELIAQAMTAYHEELKAGRRNATSDLKLINAIHAAAVALGCDECAGIADADESGKSRAGAQVSLTPYLSQLQELELSLLTQ
jgi:HK97 family phage prohead protease